MRPGRASVRHGHIASARSAVVYEVIGIYRKGECHRAAAVRGKANISVEFVRLLTANYAQHRSVEPMPTGSASLRVICRPSARELTGMTATESINNHVMVNARILLALPTCRYFKSPRNSISRIRPFFSQFFKRHEAVVPKTYRAMHRYEVGSDV